MKISKIFFFFFGFYFLLANNTLAASLYFGSHPKEIQEGERVTLSVNVRNTDEAINAISASIFFPQDLLRPISVNKEQSIINLWVGEPKINNNQISFEGVVLNPGFRGNNGLVLRITFEARNQGIANLNFKEGYALANDGLGTNVLTQFSNTNFKIIKASLPNNNNFLTEEDTTSNFPDNRLAKLPVILEASSLVDSKDRIYIVGKGEPNTLTKIVFKDVSLRSLGEELLARLQSKKTKLDSILVKNDEAGNFQYTSTSNLVAGVYNATPFLVDEDQSIEKPGLGTQILVNDSKIVKNLIVFLNVLGLFIPIVVLCVIIYFIPWYSWLRMRILKKKLGLEEEKIELTGINLARQDDLLNQNINEKK